jgi:hypothetical protein
VYEEAVSLINRAKGSQSLTNSIIEQLNVHVRYHLGLIWNADLGTTSLSIANGNFRKRNIPNDWNNCECNY